MIIALTFFLGLKHFTLSSASFAMSSNPIDVRDVDDPAPGLGPRSYNSCMLFRMRSFGDIATSVLGRLLCVPRLGEADAGLVPLEDRVVAGEDRLAEDEEVAIAESGGDEDGRHLGYARRGLRSPCITAPWHRHWQIPHVIARAEGEAEAVEVEVHVRRVDVTAISAVSGRSCQGSGDVLSPRLRDAQVRRACVEDAGTAALHVAHVKSLVADADTTDPDLPESLLGLDGLSPLEAAGKTPVVVTSDRKFMARVPVRGRTVHGKLEAPGLLREAIQEAELLGDGKALQAQAHDAVELELQEGVVGHRLRGEDAHLHADLPVRGPPGSHAEGFTHELAPDRAGAETYLRLVTMGHWDAAVHINR